MSKQLQGIVGSVLVMLLGAGILGIFKLAFAVTTLTVQVEQLQETVKTIQNREVYFHGEATPQERKDR